MRRSRSNSIFCNRKRLTTVLFYWDIGDHEALDTKADAFSASAFYYHHLVLGAEFAGILNQKADSSKYAALALKVKNTITRKYMLRGTGSLIMAHRLHRFLRCTMDFQPKRKTR
jgi:alpha-L-rhamnosidase